MWERENTQKGVKMTQKKETIKHEGKPSEATRQKWAKPKNFDINPAEEAFQIKFLIQQEKTEHWLSRKGLPKKKRSHAN